MAPLKHPEEKVSAEPVTAGAVPPPCSVCQGGGQVYSLAWDGGMRCDHCEGMKLEPPPSFRDRAAVTLNRLGSCGSAEDAKVVRRYIAALETELVRVGGTRPEKLKEQP